MNRHPEPHADDVEETDEVAPPPETLADNGAKTLQEARRDVAEIAAEETAKTRVER